MDERDPFFDTGRSLVVWEVNGLRKVTTTLGPYSSDGAFRVARLLEAYAKRKGQQGFATIVASYDVREWVLEGKP